MQSCPLALLGPDLGLWTPPTLRRRIRAWPIPELGCPAPNSKQRMTGACHKDTGASSRAPAGQMGANLHVEINELDSDLQHRFKIVKIIINVVDRVDML